MQNQVQTERRRGSRVGGVVLIALGTTFLLQKAGIIDPHLLRQWWPLVLIGVGGWLLLRHRRERSE
jgi:hypothetical protein